MAKILVWDIETSPHVADVWGLWQQNVGLNQLHKSTEMICFAAKWLGEPARKTQFFSQWGDGQVGMVKAMHELLDEADASVTFNGTTFDEKHANREFVEHGLGPVSPYKSVDILRVVKKNFRFPSNKLQYVSTALGLEGKLQHSGHSLWTQVLAGDPKAQKLMEKYNVQDVILLEKVYDKLLPWIHNGLNLNLFEGLGCPNCGSGNNQARGYSYTNQGKFQRHQCTDCGKWFKGTKRLEGTDKAGI